MNFTQLLMKHMKDENERNVVKAIEASNRVRYDWGYDEMFVWNEPGEPTDQTQVYRMSGEIFMNRMYAADKSLVSGITSACFVVDLLAQGIDVQIAIKKPLDPDFLEEYVAIAKGRTHKKAVGKLMQFVPKYKKN